MNRMDKFSFGRRYRDGAMVTALLVGVSLPLAGCQNATEPREPLVPGWLKAAFLGAPDPTIGSEMEGNARFNVNSDPAAGLDTSFQLSAIGLGASEGELISFYRPGQGRPAPGRYKLAPLTTKNGRLNGFTGYYGLQYTQGLQSFTALSGTVTIVKSTNDEIDGTFQMTLIQTCKGTSPASPDDWCAASPNVITPGAKQITVTGSFHATPASADIVPVRVGHDDP